MKISRCLYVMALIFGLSSLARATNINFHMTVLDGPITGEYITGPDFGLTFGDCPKINPNLSAYSACFYGINETGETITGLDLTFDNTLGPNNVDFTNGASPQCDASAFFDNVDGPCLLNPGTNMYELSFAGGTGIAPSGPNSSFYIAVQGLNPDAFVGGEGVATITPEPSSIVLLGTGVAMLGVFFVSRRRGQGQALRF